MVDNLYKKWRKDIEISDDEDDTHPNVDTPSLFRVRHENRLQRQEEMKEAKKELEQKKVQLNEMQRIFAATKENADGKHVEKLEEIIKSMENEFNEQESMVTKKEKLTPWNVDTIANEGFSKTSINTKKTRIPEEPMTEEEKAASLQDFIINNEALLKKFGMLQRYEDSRRFLMEHEHLVCENTTNFLVIWCIDLVLEGKVNLMNHVSHQCVAMQFLLELSKQLGTDPRACIIPFFSKIGQLENTDYKETFNAELNLLRDRIKRRAGQRMYEAKEKARVERIKQSPKGMDPLEVLESLPVDLRNCFEAQDIPLLQQTIAKMDMEEAKYHIQRCVDSGLWVPADTEEEDEDKDEKYEEIPDEEEKTVKEEKQEEKIEKMEKLDFSKFLWLFGVVAVGLLAYLCTLLY